MLVFSRSHNGLASLTVSGLALFGLALVPELFAFGESDLAFHSSILEIKTRRDERMAFLLCLSDQLSQLLFVDQQFAGAQRGVVINVAVLIGPNVRIQQ